MKSNNIKKIAARALIVAVGTVLWTYAFLLLIALADQLFGFHPEALVHRVQEAGSTTYYPAPLLVAMPAVLLSLAAVKTRNTGRLFYLGPLGAFIIIVVVIFAWSVAACAVCGQWICPGRVLRCGTAEAGMWYIKIVTCECKAGAIIPLIKALSGLV